LKPVWISRKAYDWYEERSEGLGERFLAALDETLERVADNPRTFPTVHADVRRALLQRFPFAILYRIEGEFITVLGCFHGRRNPRTWQERR
jgi:plasmid stabilization system protein ParE